MKRLSLQAAYVLHRRPYRETSLLVELLTRDEGRLTVIAKGVRKNRSETQGILQPFVPLLVSCTGKTDLLTLTHVEATGTLLLLQGEGLFSGFYLNELLMSLIQKGDANPGLFTAYGRALEGLSAPHFDETVLRSFEKTLLDELGYGILPKSTVSLHNKFLPECYYRFLPEEGWVAGVSGEQGSFSGRTLIAIMKEEWCDPLTRDEAKRLIRMVLAPLLGYRQLHSRKLFVLPEKG